MLGLVWESLKGRKRRKEVKMQAFAHSWGYGTHWTHTADPWGLCQAVSLSGRAGMSKSVCHIGNDLPEQGVGCGPYRAIRTVGTRGICCHLPRSW